MHKSFLFFVFIFCCLAAQAQHPEAKRANIWYFGNGAGLDFSSGSPVAVTNGALHTYEGCATMSDTAGNLLFYTDGDTIWDKNHQPMPNGIGLMGCPLYGSSAQAALIVPQPGHDSLYYIFTTDCWENFGAFGLRYSIINMKLNGGLGDITSMKNILLHTPITEGLTATYNCDETGVWIMSHEYNSNNYMCYFLDTNGINLIPVISSIGSVYNDYFCYMRFSPNGKFLASSFSSSSVSGELFKFDLVNGLLYDIISIPLFSGDYGTCFSPDNSKLFFTLGGADVYQFDISAYNQFDIVNSKNQIDTTDNFILGAISNGIDNKMYVAVVDEQKIGVIQSPNVYGSGSNMNLQGVMLSNKKSSLGLPDFIQNYFNESPNEPCSDTDDTLAVTKVELITSNVFTPNGDGINDMFSIILSGYKKVEWQLFNRWGNTVNSGTKILNNISLTQLILWNGITDTGIKASNGVYYYILYLTTEKDKIETKTGFTQLIN